MRRLIAAALAALALAGCSSEPAEGTIIGKGYQPGYYTSVPTCAAYGQNGVCTVWNNIPVWHPERWVLRLDSGQTANVTQAYYQAAQVGDWFSEAGESR